MRFFETRKVAFFAVLVCLGISFFQARAQEAVRGPDRGTSYHVPGVELLAIPGKPFSAKSKTVWIRTVEDGSQVTVHLTAKLARDSQGRMYRERRSFRPGKSDEETPLKDILLYDPAARTKTTCTVRLRHCIVTSYHPITSFAPAPAGSLANGTRYLTRESLGANTLQGLDVTGTRETLTINAGVVGNARPLVTTKEFWYSPELETNLAVTRRDPREGEQIIQLSEVTKAEPQPELFEIPAGFTVEDERGASLPEQD